MTPTLNRARTNSYPYQRERKVTASPSKEVVTATDLIDCCDGVAWDCDLTPSAKALAVVIRACTKRETGIAYFSDEIVAETRTGLCKRQLVRARKELVATGYAKIWRP